MRVAHTRLQVVDSFSTARTGLADRLSVLPSLGKLFGYTAMAGTGLMLSRTFLRASRGGRATAAAVVAKAPRAVNPWSALAVQTISVLVLPLAQAWLMGEKSRFRMPHFTMPKMPTVSLPEMPTVPTPSELFFRWLGLEK